MSTNAILIPFQLIFDIGIKNDSLDVDINERKPAYDINLIKYGQRPVKESDNTWISAVVVIGLLALTIAGVGIVIRNVSHKDMIKLFCVLEDKTIYDDRNPDRTTIKPTVQTECWQRFPLSEVVVNKLQYLLISYGFVVFIVE